MTRFSDAEYLDMALATAQRSPDPRTRVGAVIVTPACSGTYRTLGWSDFPDGIAATHDRLHDRPLKLQLIVHAEMRAVMEAARHGIPLAGSTLYLACTDDTGLVWGGPPRTRCTVHLIQAGISAIVTRPLKPVPSSWHDDLACARALLTEAGIHYREVPHG